MNHLAILFLAFLPFSISRGETFSSEPATISTAKDATLRGVINAATVPVPDDFELGSTQSGYFLFTSRSLTVEGEGPDGEAIKVKEQSLFHLIVNGEVEKELKALVGKPVEVKVSVMAAHTRYHRTPIVLEVKALRGLK